MGLSTCTMPCWITLSITVGIPSFLTSAIRFGDFHSPDRLRFILPAPDLIPDTIPVLFDIIAKFFRSLPHLLLLHLYWRRLFCMQYSCCLWTVSFLTVLTLPCVLSPFRSHGFALGCAVPAHLRFALPAVRYSMEHTFDYTVTLFSPSATPISGLCLLRPLLTSHSSLLLRQNCRL